MKWLLPVLFVFTLASVVLAQADNPAACPTISVDGPAGLVKPDETARYTVQIDSKGLQLNPQYFWSLSAGQILKGQGTTSVDVLQTREALTATVEVKGLPDGCPNIASATEIIDPPPQAVKLDEFTGPISQIDKSRFENIAEAVRRNPNNQLVIFVGYKERAGFDERSSRREELTHYLNLHTDEDQRITYVYVDGREIVQFWLVPPGAEEPVCDGCMNFSKSCPTVSLSGPQGLTRVGEDIVVKAIVSPDSHADIKYSWTVDKGKILKGQNTLEVVIGTDEIEEVQNKGSAEVNVHLGIGNLPRECRNSVSESYTVSNGNYDVSPFGEYGNNSFRDEKAWLDNLAINILNTHNTGYIVKHFGKQFSYKEIRRRIGRIEYFMFKLRKYPKDRFRIIVKRDDETFTKLWSFPPDAEPPGY